MRKQGIASGKMKGGSKGGVGGTGNIGQFGTAGSDAGVTPPDVPTRFDSPESSNIAYATYDPDSLQMVVAFRWHGANGGKERSYTYENIDEGRWVEFVQAASKGTFFASRIRPFFIGAPV